MQVIFKGILQCGMVERFEENVGIFTRSSLHCGHTFTDITWNSDTELSYPVLNVWSNSDR